MGVRGCRRLTRLAVAAVLAAAILPAKASAHAFLIQSQPQPGERLAKAPPAMTLSFSEPFVRGSQQVKVRRANGEEIALPPFKATGALIEQPLPARLHGAFVVSWRVLSDDGHISLGEFAFAVGSSAALPSLKASAATPWSEVVASWLVFVGLALSLGGLASERFLWTRTPLTARTVTEAPAWPGLVLAALGGLLQLVLLAGDRRGGGFAAGLSGSAIGEALGTRPGKLILALLVSVLLATALLPLQWLRVTAILPLLAAVGFVAARGHSGTSSYGWALVADIVHLAAVALWLGALAHLVLIVVRSGEPRTTLIDGARRYARFALPTVVLISATGILTAIPEFRSFSAVFTSGYGRTLLIKAALIGVALLLALAARRRALPANPRPRLPLLKRLTAAEATVLAAVLVVVSILVNLAPPRGPASAAAPPSQLGPPPVGGPSVQLGDLAGQLGLVLTAGAKELQFVVVPPGAQGAGSLKLRAEAKRPSGRSVDLYPRPCGRTCFAISFRLTPGTTLIRAQLSSSAWRGGTVHFAVPWPLPPEQPALLRRIARAMSAVRTLTLKEAVTSGPGSHARNSATFSGREFLATELYRNGAVDVRVVGRKAGLTEIAFALPGSSIWYRIWVGRDFRLRRELILSPGHRIRRTFGYGAATRPRRTRPAQTVTPTGPLTPPPPGAVVLGKEDGDLGVGLAARIRGSGLELQTTVLSPEGGGLNGLSVSYDVHGPAGDQSADAADCGSGCYRARVGSARKPTLVSVRLAGAGRPPSTVDFELAAGRPARPRRSSAGRRASSAA